jgi:ubiquinone/menaquinone biosynthesis C-methylase UbiE
MMEEMRVNQSGSSKAPASTAFKQNQVAYLDNFRGLEWAHAYKMRSFEYLGVRQGDSILEVGCGAGDDSLLLAQRVGPTGRVVGIDAGEDMISEAKRRAESSHLPVEFFVQDACNLEFPDNTFDGCRADQVFQHIGDPRKGVSEVIRVARPGARIVICDPDWETLALDSANKKVTRKIVNYRCDVFRSGWIGRQLAGLFKSLGLADVFVSADVFVITDFSLANKLWRLRDTAGQASKAGAISEQDASDWIRQLEEADRNGLFFGAVTGFAAVGQKS